eukprot:gene29611-17892_t
MAVDSHSRAGASSPNEMANCNNIDATGLDESSANNKCTTACDDFSNITGNTGSDKRGSIGVTDIDESIANNNGATGVLAGPIPHQVQSMEVSVDAGQPAQRKSRWSSTLPVINRRLAYGIHSGVASEVNKTSDNRYVVIIMPKARTGERWRRLFQGDPDGARCVDPPTTVTAWPNQEGPSGCTASYILVQTDGNAESPSGCPASYSLVQTEGDVVLEMLLPFWVQRADVHVEIDDTGFEVVVDDGSALHIRRQFWTDPSRRQVTLDQTDILYHDKSERAMQVDAVTS